MQQELEKQFALKTKIMGAAPGLHKELTILNRRVSWNDDGIKYEPDEKHVMQMTKDLNINTYRILILAPPPQRHVCLALENSISNGKLCFPASPGIL